METKRWKDFYYEKCPACTGELEIYTDSIYMIEFDEGDKLRCKICDMTGYTIITDDYLCMDSDTCITIRWDEE